MEHFIHQATSDIFSLLTRPPKSIASFLQLVDATRNGILQVAHLLHSDQVTSAVLKYQHQLNTNEEENLSLPRAPPSLGPSQVIHSGPYLAPNSPSPSQNPILSPCPVPSTTFLSSSLSYEHKSQIKFSKNIYNNVQGCSRACDL